jgi:hypothetical protein
MIYETDTNRVLVWDNAAWVMIADTDTPPGMELVKTQAVGSGISSVVVTGAFSADYDSYRITYTGGTQSSSTDFSMRLGSSTTGYFGWMIYGQSNGGSGVFASQNNTGLFPWIGGGSAGQASHVSVDVMSPFLSGHTKFRNGSYQNDDLYGTMNGEHRVATSYTEFTLFPNVGTITGGTIRVYGYRN